MREEAVRKFLYAVGADNLKRNGDWINVRCPMAPYTHSGGADTHPSFGVSISNEGPSVYWCFGCTEKARLLGWLLHNLYVMTGRYPWEAAKVFVAEENFDDTKKVEIPDGWKDAERRTVEPIPYHVLRKYPLLQTGRGFEARRCRSYLDLERGIPDWVQNLCRIRYSAEDQALVFPLTDIRGGTYLCRMRSRKKKSIWTLTPERAGVPELEFPRLVDAGVWFGMFLIDWSRPVMVVEAEMDAARLKALGYFNAIASATSNVTDAQIDSLTADTLILGYDADRSGQHAHARIRDRLEGKVNLFEADWRIASACRAENDQPEKWDAGELRNKEELSMVLAGLKPVGG
uniref:Putative DNA topoisomerase-primase n=1 Tax=viral metagenome TaxID=1070528 RepID=A0A6M3LVQ2_9ZZZZ